MTNLDSILKNRDITLPTKVHLVKPMVFPYGSHVWMWELGYKESWAPKNWCFWTVVLEKTLESPLDCKEIQPVHPKGNQSWIFIGRTDAEAETPIVWPPDSKSWLIWRLMLRKIEGSRRRGRQRMRWLDDIINGMDMNLSKLPRISDWQGGLVCCDSWGRKESDTTERLNWTVKSYKNNQKPKVSTLSR